MADLIEIKDFNDPALDVYARLREKQLFHYFEPEPGIFIAESPNVILRALDKGCVPLSLLAEEKQLEGPAKEVLRRCGSVPVYTANLEVLRQLTGFALTRGLLCAMKRPALPAPGQICSQARRLAVLEHIMNPTNIGAIFRSAAALNMDGILLTKSCCDPLSRRAIRVSMGTIFQIPWTYLEDGPSQNAAAALARLKTAGFKSAAMALRDDTISIAHPCLAAEKKLAVVLGSEGEGLESETIDACDYRVRIPMSHGVDSLNVAAASAVAFWQLAGPADHSH